MKKFFAEFKKFITRGNVVDMAVGVIVGGAFTSIVNGLSNFILKPIINWIIALIIGKDGLSGAITPLSPVYKVLEDGTKELDLANSIYIDWGAFISTVINFFIIAFVLFTIVKIINNVKDEQKKVLLSLDDQLPSRQDRKEMKKLGIKFSDHAAVSKYFAEKAAKAAAEEAAAKAAAEEKARLEREANPTTEDLLKKIILILEQEKQ
jgi:large conductance mechanosensitive channel